MSIKSDAFGSVTLSGKDAKKFEDQVTYGKPKAAAFDSIEKGVELSRKLQQAGGDISVPIKRAQLGG
jgi:hypothetical protein